MKIVIALPVFNEEAVLRSSVETLVKFLQAEMPGYEASAVIADNGSVDRTPEIGRELERGLDGAVRYLRIDGRGKGLAIRSAWQTHDADVYVFMDADLATDLSALPKLAAAISAGADLAIGSRFHPSSRVSRSWKRKLLSRGYRWWLRLLFKTTVSDAPCGFKAVSSRVMREINPLVRDDGWFFDTELVLRAERAGLIISEAPVIWREAPAKSRKSKLGVAHVVAEYLRKTLALRREFATGK